MIYVLSNSLLEGFQMAVRILHPSRHIDDPLVSYTVLAEVELHQLHCLPVTFYCAPTEGL